MPGPLSVLMIALSVTSTPITGTVPASPAASRALSTFRDDSGTGRQRGRLL
jgi:hypothetical protein